MASVIAFGVLALAAWLAITLAVILENATRRFRDDVAVESIYGVPVIGKIPAAHRLPTGTAFFLSLGTNRRTAHGTEDQ
jgi:hypothetical protein